MVRTWIAAAAITVVSLCPTRGSGAEPTTSTTNPPRELAAIRLALLHSQGLDDGELRRQLALRMPDVPLTTWTGQETVTATPFAVIDVRARDASEVHVTVIVSDGRVFHRDIHVVADPPEREIASELANLLISVGKHEIEADEQTDAPPNSPHDLDDSDTASPRQRNDTVLDEPANDDPDLHSSSSLELGVTVDGGTWLEVGPPSYGRIRGPSGGALTLALRWPVGVRAQISLLPAGRRVESLMVMRWRVAAGAGIATRWRHAELDAGIDVAVEPWRARINGDAVSFLAGERPGPVLLGLGAVVLAGWRWSAPNPRVIRHVVVGPSLRVSGSFAVGGDDGATAVGLAVQDTAGLDRVLRLGGFELWTGLGLRAWFGLGPRR